MGEGKGERRVEREGRMKMRMRMRLMCLEKNDFGKEMEKQNKKKYIY